MNTIKVIDRDGQEITVPKRGVISPRGFYVSPIMQADLIKANMNAEVRMDLIQRANSIEHKIILANAENAMYYRELRKAEDKKWDKIKAKRNNKRGRK